MIDSGFGNWLAGFIAGEGCFTISKLSRGRGYRCSFALVLRLDDAPILEMIHTETQLGTISVSLKTRESVEWAVLSRKDCVALIEILDCCPLRARKEIDYFIWREAVRIWNSKPSMKWASLEYCQVMQHLKSRLEHARDYKMSIRGHYKVIPFAKRGMLNA